MPKPKPSLILSYCQCCAVRRMLCHAAVRTQQLHCPLPRCEGRLHALGSVQPQPACHLDCWIPGAILPHVNNLCPTMISCMNLDYSMLEYHTGGKSGKRCVQQLSETGSRSRDSRHDLGPPPVLSPAQSRRPVLNPAPDPHRDPPLGPTHPPGHRLTPYRQCLPGLGPLLGLACHLGLIQVRHIMKSIHHRLNV